MFLSVYHPPDQCGGTLGGHTHSASFLQCTQPLDGVTTVIQRWHQWQQRRGGVGGKDSNYLLTHLHISLLSGWFYFLIYFDLLGN